MGIYDKECKKCGLLYDPLVSSCPLCKRKREHTVKILQDVTGFIFIIVCFIVALNILLG